MASRDPALSSEVTTTADAVRVAAIGRRPHAISATRKRVALAIGVLSDLTQFFFFPVLSEGALSPFEIALDTFTALVILLVVGFQWRLAVALVAELVPGLDMFPTWTAVVLSLPTACGTTATK